MFQDTEEPVLVLQPEGETRHYVFGKFGSSCGKAVKNGISIRRGIHEPGGVLTLEDATRLRDWLIREIPTSPPNSK